MVSERHINLVISHLSITTKALQKFTLLAVAVMSNNPET
jgi:hypothetical protein